MGHTARTHASNMDTDGLTRTGPAWRETHSAHMAWDLVPADAASALPRLHRARPTPTCSATSTPRSCPCARQQQAAQQEPQAQSTLSH
eukprot:3939407-Prymnesium_polylepis.1